MDGLPALDLWDFVIEVLGNDPKNTKTNGVKTQITPKIRQVLDQNVDLSNIDQVPSNAHLFEKESQLYIFEDSGTGYLFDRVNLDPSPNQVCGIQKPTSRHFIRRQFHA